MVWFKIAFRNILKNARRSFFTVIAISVGFAAVNMFAGFQAYVFQGLRDAVIYAQAQGHVSIFKKGAQANVPDDPLKRLITPDEKAAVEEELSKYPQVMLTTEQIQISGLLSNGDISTVFIALGRTPSQAQMIRRQARGMIGKIKLFTGEPLKDDISFGIGLSSGLAEKLNTGIGSDVIAMAPTIDGQINAMDAKILQLFESPAAELNDKYMVVPLEFAQSLYNTHGVDEILVLLENTEDSISIKERLNLVFAKNNLDLVAMTWEEIAPFYIKVKDMFLVIFWFLFIIMLIIVVMSVINTMSMAVMERIKEIGTIRAMGVKRRGIIKQFAIESVLLSCFGSLFGIGLTLIGWGIVKVLEPTWIPPHITIRVPIEVYIETRYLVATAAALIILSFVAAIFPARKAARMTIVDALGTYLIWIDNP